MQEKYMYFKRC